MLIWQLIYIYIYLYNFLDSKNINETSENPIF